VWSGFLCSPVMTFPWGLVAFRSALLTQLLPRPRMDWLLEKVFQVVQEIGEEKN
jgi:hypothetical protein